jgi:hypothetical protein
VDLQVDANVSEENATFSSVSESCPTTTGFAISGAETRYSATRYSVTSVSRDFRFLQ